MRAHPDFVFKGEAINRVDTQRLLEANSSLDLSWTDISVKLDSLAPRS